VRRPACNWAQDAKARPTIVMSRCQYDGRAMTTLLRAKRGIEIDPNEVAGIWTVVTRLRCQQAVPTREGERGGSSRGGQSEPGSPRDFCPPPTGAPRTSGRRLHSLIRSRRRRLFGFRFPYDAN
jgi:hypothetical protein